LNLGDVGAGLIEAREGFVVVDVLCDVIWEIFEVLKRSLEIGVYR
jgi:hypothetical protein